MHLTIFCDNIGQFASDQLENLEGGFFFASNLKYQSPSLDLPRVCKIYRITPFRTIECIKEAMNMNLSTYILISFHVSLDCDVTSSDDVKSDVASGSLPDLFVHRFLAVLTPAGASDVTLSTTDGFSSDCLLAVDL